MTEPARPFGGWGDPGHPEHQLRAPEFADRDTVLGHLRHGLAHRDALMAVLVVRLDGLELLVESLSLDELDGIIRRIGARLLHTVRPSDVVGQLDSGTFCLVCGQVGQALVAVRMAERIDDIFRVPFDTDLGTHRLEASIGIALGDHASSAEDLLQDASAAAARAREPERGPVELFDPDIRQSALARLTTEQGLYGAMQQGELEVHYQPIYTTTDSRLAGAEALVRWRHPSRGLLLPDEFLAVAEDNPDLIRWIGGFVLDTSTRELTEASPDLVLAVNVSARQFSDPFLVKAVEVALGETGMDPAHLALEITESVIMDDVGHSREVLKALKLLGVTLVADDFGTGYSSLAYLKRLPLDALKVDRSFVSGLGPDSSDTAIVRAVIGLASSLGLVTVAEGVETEAQLEILRELGCDLAQGHLLGRPARKPPAPG